MKKRVIQLFAVFALIISAAVTEVPVLPVTAVKAEAAETVSGLKAPKISKKSGTYQDKVKVTIKNQNEKGKLYYTTNGKTPTAKSKQYKKTLTFRKDTTLKVICIDGSQKSAVVTKKYVIEKPSADFQPVDESQDTTFSHVSKYINALAYGTVSSLSQTDKKICRAIQDILEEQISSTMTTEEKAKAIHDYLINQTVYDWENYQADTIPRVSYSVEGVLLKKKAVCQGYAETYYLFMHLLDIPCKIITGPNHAWNLVKLSDGCWYHVDLTWDDPVTEDGSDMIRYLYLFADDSMMKADHQWKEADYPVCDGTEYLYYGYGDCRMSSVKEAEAAVRKAALEGKTELTVLYPEEGLPDMSAIFRAAGVYSISYTQERIGNYTIFTVIWK